jgi:hypothetical protein
MSNLKLWMNSLLPEQQRIVIADAEITALQAENERLKCCGNCGNYIGICNKKPFTVAMNMSTKNCCLQSWQPDNLTRKEREK